MGLPKRGAVEQGAVEVPDVGAYESLRATLRKPLEAILAPLAAGVPDLALRRSAYLVC